MIDRVASRMLGDLAFPMSPHQVMHVGIALLDVWMALDFWQRARKGRSLTLSPWMLRTGAIVAGASALWAIYNVRSLNGSNAGGPTAPVPTPMPAPAGGAPIDWRYVV